MSVTVPTPQRINNKLTEEFYPLQKDELIKLYEVGLIKSAAYVHFALRLENPFCDRPVQIIPKEFALRWKIPEKSVYRAIARLKELGILNIKSGKLVVEWNKPEEEEPTEEVKEVTVNETQPSRFSEVRTQTDDSQSCEKILRVEKKFSELRKNSQSCENQGLKPLSDIAYSIPQTLQTVQTNQTKRRKEKKSNQEAVQKIVQESTTETESELTTSELTTDIQNESVGQTNAKVVQEKTKIISPSKSSAEKDVAIPNDLRERLEELEIRLDAQVLKAIASHHISQAYGAAAHVENTKESIINTRAVFLHQLPQQRIEKLGDRYSEELLSNVKAQNQAIEKERSDPEYFEKSKDAFAQIRETLRKKAN